MEVAALISIATGLLEIYKQLRGEDGQFLKLKQALEKVERLEPAVRSVIAEITHSIQTQNTEDWIRAVEAADANPALKKPTPVGPLASLALVSLLALSVAGCAPRASIIALPETETRHAAYVVTWPDDASTRAEDYHTTMTMGRMATSTRRMP